MLAVILVNALAATINIIGAVRVAREAAPTLAAWLCVRRDSLIRRQAGVVRSVVIITRMRPAILVAAAVGVVLSTQGGFAAKAGVTLVVTSKRLYVIAPTIIVMVTLTVVIIIVNWPPVAIVVLVGALWPKTWS